MRDFTYKGQQEAKEAMIRKAQPELDFQETHSSSYQGG